MYSIFWLLLGILPVVQVGDIDLASESRNLRRISSLSGDVHRNWRRDTSQLPPNVSGVEPVVSEVYTLVESGVCFRVETEDDVNAFNGTLFQALYKDSNTYVETQELNNAPVTPYGTPIRWLYFWAFPPQGNGSFQSIKDAGVWDAIAANCEGLADNTIAYDKYLPSGDVYRYEIQFDATGHVNQWASYKMPDRIWSSSVNLISSKIFSTDVGDIWIPTKVEVKAASSSGTVWFDEDTLRINDDIDADVFALSRLSATHVITDLDRMESDAAELLEATESPNRAFGFVLLLVISLVIGGFIWRRSTQ